jgi:hypothetical protein
VGAQCARVRCKLAEIARREARAKVVEGKKGTLMGTKSAPLRAGRCSPRCTSQAHVRAHAQAWTHLSSVLKRGSACRRRWFSLVSLPSFALVTSTLTSAAPRPGSEALMSHPSLVSCTVGSASCEVFTRVVV